MAETKNIDDGYPWLSWALTGFLSLASVLIIGLAISVWDMVVNARQIRRDAPAEPEATQNEPANNAKPPGRPAASTSSPPTEPVPAAGKSSDKPPLPPADVASSEAKQSAPPDADAAPAPAVPVSAAPPAQSQARSPDPVPVAPGHGRPDVPAQPPAIVKVAPAPTVANPAPVTQDPTKRAAFVRAVAEVRAAMGQRNLAASKRGLHTAAPNVQGPADQAELERLQALQDHLEQFWDGIRQAVAAMQPLDEIVLSESDRVAVIAASREELAVQREGRPRHCRIEALPMDLLWAIARQSFKPTPGSKLIVGSFLAMDSLGDRHRAEMFWQEAIRSGESEGKLLLPELKVPRAGQGKR